MGRFVFTVSVLACCFFPSAGTAQQRNPKLPKLGVLRTSENVSPGYTLISPLSTEKVFLLNNAGEVEIGRAHV